MSISDLGSLGELIGSIAVVITLIVLIFQIRGARIEFASQMTRDIKRDNNETFHQLTQRPDLVDIHIRGQRDFDSLTEVEKLTWMTWIFTWITQTEDAWLARNRGIPNMEWVDGYLRGVALVIRSEGGQTVWPRLRPNYDNDFALALEQAVESQKSTFLEAVLDSEKPEKTE